MDNPPKLNEYNKKGDSNEHVQLVNDRLNYFNIDEAFKCKFFTLTLVGSAMIWFNGLPDRCIESWTYFCKRFTTHFTARKRKLMMVVTLSGIIQGKNYILRSYIE